MLIQFSVQNYRSFAEMQTISFEATNISEFKENVFTSAREKLLKSIAVYGANSSGKSNLLNAMSEMRNFIFVNVKKSSAESIDYDPFLLKPKFKNEPSFFEIVFRIDMVKYRYGFEIDQNSVRGEWLFKTNKVKEIPLFIRVDDGIEVFKNFPEGKNLEERTKHNSLFLSVIDQFNGEESGKVIQWFNNFNIIDGTFHNNYRGVTFSMLSDNEINTKLNKFYQSLDLGFKNLRIEKEVFNRNNLPIDMPEELVSRIVGDLDGETIYSLTSTHAIYDNENVATENEVIFNVREMESAGTNKVIDLSGPIFDTLSEGGVLAIDELDAKLHPLLTISLMKLFQNSSSNSKNAQLLFTTHSTSLLNRGDLRRDQIYFTEKNSFEATELYALVEYNLKGKKIRKDNSFEKDYLNRRYGGVPQLGNPNSIEWLVK